MSVILENAAQAILLFLCLIMLLLYGACQASGLSSTLGECSRYRLFLYIYIYIYICIYAHTYIQCCSYFLGKTGFLLVLLLLTWLCNTALLKTNNINKSEAMPTIAEYSQCCQTLRLAEQCVNVVVSEMSVSLFFFNFWKDLSGECVFLNKVINVINM